MRDPTEEVEDRLEIDELLVRGFVTIGVVIWTVAALGALLAGNMAVFYGYGVVALVVLSAFVIGLYDERIAAVELTIVAGGIIAWGIVSAWELGIWLMVGAMLIVPVAIAAGMYWFAEHEEEVLAHEETAFPTHAVRA